MKNKNSEIRILANGVLDFGRENDLHQNVLDDIRLAFEEMFSNIVSYGFDDDREHEIVMDMELSADLLTMKIRDDGRPFNPTEYVNPDLEKPLDEREVGGLGIHLVRHVIDEWEYKSEQGKNILTMKKWIRKSVP
ncbi:MAG: ATP-binding protein [Desulfobacteraceae bacterium]|nr:ATP-binding protein [Desulfobacteraceae bacterium]